MSCSVCFAWYVLPANTVLDKLPCFGQITMFYHVLGQILVFWVKYHILAILPVLFLKLMVLLLRCILVFGLNLHHVKTFSLNIYVIITVHRFGFSLTSFYSLLFLCGSVLMLHFLGHRLFAIPLYSQIL